MCYQGCQYENRDGECMARSRRGLALPCEIEGGGESYYEAQRNLAEEAAEYALDEWLDENGPLVGSR